MSARRAERKASPLFEIALVLVRLDHVARCIVNTNHRVVRAAETAGPLAREIAQKAKRVAVGSLFGGQPTMELMIANLLDARTSDFIEPLHGN